MQGSKLKSQIHAQLNQASHINYIHDLHSYIRLMNFKGHANVTSHLGEFHKYFDYHISIIVIIALLFIVNYHSVHTTKPEQENKFTMYSKINVLINYNIYFKSGGEWG